MHSSFVSNEHNHIANVKCTRKQKNTCDMITKENPNEKKTFEGITNHNPT